MSNTEDHKDHVEPEAQHVDGVKKYEVIKKTPEQRKAEKKEKKRLAEEKKA